MLGEPNPAYATRVLNPNNSSHAALVFDIDRYADDAGIPKRWFWAPLDQAMTPAEIEWCKGFKLRRKNGTPPFNLCLTGAAKSADAPVHIAAMAGAMVRNSIRARVFTVEGLLSAEAWPEASCLLIPDFYLGAELGAWSKWQSKELYSLLTDRNVRDLPTVVYAADTKSLVAVYGRPFANLIGTAYEEIAL